MKDPAVVRANLALEYNSLGSISFHEAAITSLFFSLVFLWFFPILVSCMDGPVYFLTGKRALFF